MTMIKNKAAEREEIEGLLPWHAAGTLNRRDAQKVEQALAGDADLATQYATVQQDLVETIGLNESLGAPSARAMQKLMADIEADTATSRRTQKSFNFGAWLSDRLSSFSPRTLAWSATGAAFAVVLQAGLLAGMFVTDRPGGSFFSTASVQSNQVVRDGTYAMISFAPQATAGEITKLLETYKIAVVEGPSGGVYKVRLAVTSLPKEEVAKVLKRLQDENSVRFVGPTSAE
jgi:anti-sigma-K factor RskA